MNVLVGRHAISAANDRNNIGTLLFGHPDAPLIELGCEQSYEMGNVFRTKYGIDLENTEVAVSAMRRSQDTARAAGFIGLKPYDILNEVDTLLDYPILREWIDQKRHSDVAIKAAELILKNPPKESVWITHGLVIASLCEILGIVNQFDDFVPKFCEIRELPIDR